MINWLNKAYINRKTIAKECNGINRIKQLLPGLSAFDSIATLEVQPFLYQEMVLGKDVIIRCIKFPLEVQLQYAINTDAVARTGN